MFLYLSTSLCLIDVYFNFSSHIRVPYGVSVCLLPAVWPDHDWISGILSLLSMTPCVLIASWHSSRHNSCCDSLYKFSCVCLIVRDQLTLIDIKFIHVCLYPWYLNRNLWLLLLYILNIQQLLIVTYSFSCQMTGNWHFLQNCTRQLKLLINITISSLLQKMQDKHSLGTC